MPHHIKPMLATLAEEPFTSEEWLYEIKWDGYRAVAEMNEGKIALISRNLTSFTKTYLPVAEALADLKINAVLDGEIIALDEKGAGNFQQLQNWQKEPVQLQYCIFDIIWMQGYDLTNLPLLVRKTLLQNVLPTSHAIIKYSDHIVGDGEAFFKLAVEKGLEGIMAKKANSIYQVGVRNNEWLKIKVNQRQEVIIAGFTQPRNTRQFFGALLLGAYKKDRKSVV